MHIIRSHLYSIFTEEVNKVASDTSWRMVSTPSPTATTIVKTPKENEKRTKHRCTDEETLKYANNAMNVIIQVFEDMQDDDD